MSAVSVWQVFIQMSPELVCFITLLQMADFDEKDVGYSRNVRSGEERTCEQD